MEQAKYDNLSKSFHFLSLSFPHLMSRELEKYSPVLRRKGTGVKRKKGFGERMSRYSKGTVLMET